MVTSAERMAGDRPLRLALISSGLGHELRGIEMWMAELALHLPEALEVEVWAGGGFQLPGGHRRIRRIWNLGRHHPLIRAFSWLHRYQIEQYSAIPAALGRLRQWRPDVIYCGDPLLSWNLKRFRHRHGARVVFMNGMRLTPRWLQNYDGIHLLAPPYLREAREILPAAQAARFFAVPHFTDTVQFAPATVEQRARARTRWRLPADGLVVLTVGPVGSVSGKRLGFLAEELAAVPGALLVSAGGDEDGAATVRAHAQAALGSRLRLLGRVDRDAIRTLYQAADVYSLGSLAEPFSIAILEALASALPVVHHHDEVMIWQTGGGGVPVDFATSGSPAAAFGELNEDSARRQKLALAARALAVERYAPEPVCAALVQELRRLAGRPLLTTV